jgi:hypothetical protein
MTTPRKRSANVKVAIIMSGIILRILWPMPSGLLPQKKVEVPMRCCIIMSKLPTRSTQPYIVLLFDGCEVLVP